MKLDGRQSILIWAVIALSAGLSAVLGWYWTSYGARWLTHTVEVQLELSELTTLAYELEVGQRGYLLTGDPLYLENYRTAKAQVPERTASLKSRVGDNTAQTQRIDGLTTLLGERIAIIEETIAQRAAGQQDAAIAVVQSGRGRKVMDKIRALVSEAQIKEQDLYTERENSYERQRLALLLGLLGMLGASAVLAMVSVSRERERRETVEAAARVLTTSNQALEDRVQERTSQIEVEKARAEALLRDVTHRIGNTLALVVAFINLHIRHATDKQAIEILTGARTRIHAIASAQRRLNVANDLELVRLDTLIESVLSDVVAANSSEVEIEVEIPPLLSAAQFATSVCVLIQEFVMNAIKHAFGDLPDGKIVVTMRRTADEGGVIVIADNGRGMVSTVSGADGDAEPTSDDGGLGSKIAGLLTRQFGGTIRYEPAHASSDRPGTRVIINLPEIALVESSDDQQNVARTVMAPAA